MTPTDVANRNVAWLMIITAIVGALAYAGYWLLTSDHSIAVRLRAVMSRLRIVGDDDEPTGTEQRSYAGNGHAEPHGTEALELVPDLAEQLSTLDDDTLLAVLSLVRDAEGEYRFAESRVAKFIPGRVEDRLDQVRDVRGTEKPAKGGRVLRVRDERGERVIPFR